MIAIVSPAKSLELEKEFNASTTTNPVFNAQANELAQKLATFAPEQIGELMHISENLSQLNSERYNNWNHTQSADNKRPALFMFDGDVYTGLDAFSFTKQEVEHAQNSLRILSGIYGVLKPLDLMQPYRLEMGTKWQIDTTTKNLYEFWGNTVTEQLNKDLEATNSNYLINLASNEYFKVIKKKEVAKPIVNIAFKDEKNGKLKVVAFFAKKARGAMARYIIQKQPRTLDDLKLFNGLGYAYQESLSTEETELVFTR